MKELVLEVQNGLTLINKYEDGSYNIQFLPDSITGLHDVIIEFKEFLLACGYAKETIETYIEEY